MYSRRQTRPKPRSAESRKWDAPTSGWVSNRALATPDSIEGSGAAVLDNFFPKSTGVALRRGKQLYATLEDTTLPVRSLFSYRDGTNERLYGANDHTIYDLSNIAFPGAGVIGNGSSEPVVTENGDELGFFSTAGFDKITGYTDGNWSVVQYATTGGIYLLGVNGVDTGFVFDGTDFFPNVKDGTTRIQYDGATGTFAKGDVIDNGSGATATVFRAEPTDAATGYLDVFDLVGTFADNDSLSGKASVSGAPALAAPGIDFGDGVTSADMSFVWVYKNRVWFAQKESLNSYYLAVDSIGGAAEAFPLGGIFANGGALLFGQRWSLESGGDGGLSEQCIFVTTEGEVAIYQGISPDEAATWNIVGVYRIGSPLGKRAYLRGGGDLAIATTVGLVPLSKAISLDVTALNTASVSYKIADAWTEAINLRGLENWQAMIWPEGKLAAIAPPDLNGSSSPVMFVSNTETGAWARFTNWQALCMDTYGGTLFFGSPDGKVFKANVGGFDDGEAYSGAVVPLFDDMGFSVGSKVGKMARARVRANAKVNDSVRILSDFNIDLPAAPDATKFSGSNTWGDGEWGSSVWGSETTSIINQDWRSAGSIGYSMAPCYQVTSGSVAALDVELIDMTTLHTTAEAVT